MTTPADAHRVRPDSGTVPAVREEHSRPDLHLLAPIIAVGATMIVRKALDSSYRKVTGRQAPGPRDTTSGLMRVVAWTALTAAIAAVVEVAVYRLTEGQQGEQV